MSKNVKVRYVDKATGNVITNIKNEKTFGEKDSENRYTAAKDVLIDSEYNVTDRAYRTLSTTDDKYYRLVAANNGLADGSEPATGRIGTDDKVVTFLYEVAEKPATPTTGKGVVHFKKQVTDTTTEKLTGYDDITLEGNVGDTFSSTDVNTRITALKNAGYEIVSDTFTNGDRIIDSTADVDGQDPSQVYNVVVREKVETVTTPPTPNTPVDPNIPEGPKWPETGLKESDLTKEVTRTINYFKKETADGEKIADAKPTKVDKVLYKRTATYNLVSKTVTYGKWTPTADDTHTATSFSPVKTPVLTGYVADIKEVTDAPAAPTANGEVTNMTKEVVYTKLGSWVPNIPGKNPTPIPYPNDPDDATKPKYPDYPTTPENPGGGNENPGGETPGTPEKPKTPELPVIPYEPGYTPGIPTDPTQPVDPKTNPLVPLTPVDPKDPKKGYKVPEIPEKPGNDTPITYVADPQKALVKVVKVEGEGEKQVKTPLENDTVYINNGSTDAAIPTGSVTDKIADLEKRGYIVENKDLLKDQKFDKVKDPETGDPTQVFELRVREKLVPVTPPTEDKPITPGTPIDPDAPVDPKNPNDPLIPTWTEDLIKKVKNAETTKEVTRTINYVDESGAKLTYTDNGKETKDPKTDKVTFTREAKINVVTKEITYGEWTAKDNDTTFEAVTSPVVKGYILKANQDTQNGLVSTDGTSVVASTNLTAGTENQNVNVVYTKLGSWIPKVPGVETPTPLPYPNHPTDPTKPGDPTDPNTPNVPVIPYVPGYTPKIGETPLQPKVPNDPTQGYIPPAVPTEPGTNTDITYVADPQKAVVKVFNTTTGTEVELPEEKVSIDNGTTDSAIPTDSVTAKIADLEKRGYVVENKDLLNNQKFDKEKDPTDGDPTQVFNLKVHEKVVTVTEPKNPNEPVDPDKPDGPKWPETGLAKSDLEKEVTRTITYVKKETADGPEIADAKPTKKQTAHFKRSATYNLVTKVVTPGDWTSTDKTLEAVPTEKLDGYVANVPSVEEVETNVNSTNLDRKVVYTKLGSWVPKVPGVETPTPLPYPNHPTDPTKPGDPTDPNTPNVPVIPYVPGYTPKIGETPLQPKVPNDPTQGYIPPAVPTEPGTNTDITYVADPQKAVVKVFNTTTGTEVELPEEKVSIDNGTTDSAIPTDSVTAKIADLEKRGYIVENKDLLKDQKFDKEKDPTDGDPTQVFKLLVKERTVEVTEPKNPNDPVDPDKPEGPKWPKWPETGLKESDLKKEVTRTITYVKKETVDGPEIENAKPTVTQTAHFKRSATYNVVTGTITYGNWESADKELAKVDTPELTGYVADKASVDKVETNADSTGLDQKVVYTKLGSWVPRLPEGVTPPTGTDMTPKPYPNNPTDPTKPGTPVYPEPGTPTDPNTPKPPVIPYVPGYTPKTPDGNPLVPVDPNHPENGYKVPPVPTTPGKDTPITYEKVPDKPKPETTGTKEVTRTIKYVDEKGNELAKPSTDKVTFTGNGSDWNAVGGDSTFDAVKSPVVKGYILKDPAQKVVEKETVKSDAKDETITVTYTKVGSFVPKVPEGATPRTPLTPTPYDNDPEDPTKVVTPNPEKPQDPKDPNSPKVPVIPQVPGHTPVVPKDPTKPVSPENPLVPLTPVDPNHPEKGYNVPPVPTIPGQDTPITYVKDGQQKAITSFVDPKGNVLETPIIETGDSNTPLTKDGEIKATIAKLKLKGYDVETNTYPPTGTFDNDPKVDQYFKVTLTPRVKPVKPFDPTNPKDPNKPVPGQPIDPDTPVDPNNPNAPTIPRWTEDLINKLETTKQVTRTINYVDEAGNKVSEPSTDKVTFTREAKINVVTGEITYGDWKVVGGDSTFDRVTSPVVKGYILKDPAQKEVAERKGITPTIANQTIEVVYKKLGSWIPKVPGVETPTPLPYPNNPTDPTKPGDPTDPNTPNVPVIPYVPGYTPKIGETPLQPKVPNDPTQGYIPPVPTEPGKDTPIEYVKVPNTPSPEEPVKPTPESNHITIWVDENGKPLKPEKPGTHEPGNIPGYRLITTVTKDGITIHKFEKITPVDPNRPTPDNSTPEVPIKPTPTPEEQDTPVTTYTASELPKTGTASLSGIFTAEVAAILAGLGILIPGVKKKETEE